MKEPSIVLLFGDPYRCELALAKRDAAILSEHPERERHVRFADELNLPELRAEFRSSSLFSDSRHFVIRNTEEARKPKELGNLLVGETHAKTFITFIAKELKSSSKLIGIVKSRGNVRSLPQLKGGNLDRAAREILSNSGLSIGDKALGTVLTRCGKDLLGVWQEAKKLRSFGAEGVIDERLIEKLTFTAGEESTYSLLDRVGLHDIGGSLTSLAAIDENSGRVFSSLLRHLSTLLTLRVLLANHVPPPRMRKIVARPDWLIKKLLRQAKSHGVEQLVSLLDLAIDLDIEMKSGHIRPRDALLKLVLASTAPAVRAQECAPRNRLSPATIG